MVNVVFGWPQSADKSRSIFPMNFPRSVVTRSVISTCIVTFCVMRQNILSSQISCFLLNVKTKQIKKNDFSMLWNSLKWFDMVWILYVFCLLSTFFLLFVYFFPPFCLLEGVPKKSSLAQNLSISKKFLILIWSSWYSSNQMYSWDDYFHQVS